MRIRILQNTDQSFYDTLKDSLKWAENACLAVAYGSYGAFDSLKLHFQSFLRNNGKLRALFDIEEFITDRKLIEEFATIPGDSDCRIFIKKGNIAGSTGSFHPKYYLFYNTINYRIIIGSSNFTLGGIKRNIECNLAIHGAKDELFNEFLDFFNSLWLSDEALNVLSNSELLEMYQTAFLKSRQLEKTKAYKLRQLREKIEVEVKQIIESKRNLINEEFAYLLGLMIANGKLDDRRRKLSIELHRGLANKGKSYEGYYYNPDISDYKISQYDAHRKDVDRIIENLNLLIRNLEAEDEVRMEHVGGYRFRINIFFGEESTLFRGIKDMNLLSDKGKFSPLVPQAIQKSKSSDVKLAFVRGYSDLKSRISVSDGIYDTKKKNYGLLRMGISFPHGASKFMNQFLRLLKSIGIEKGVNATDPTRRSRENLVRIDVRNVPYNLVGTHWRRIFLKDFVSYMQSKSVE